MKHTATLLLFILTFYTSTAQINIDPIVVAPGSATVGATHLVYNPSSTPLNNLFLFIPGSDAPSGFYSNLLEFAAGLGYHVIAIGYDNTVNTGTFFNSSDIDAFKNFRQEVGYGTPGCPDIDVDTNNSIYTRSAKLLYYLDSVYPTIGWGQFLNNLNEPIWDSVTIGGHSQGAGHAYYLAQRNAVERVIAFSGPNDHSDYFNAPANWLSEATITPRTSYYAYLNLNDDGFINAFENVRETTQTLISDTVNVDINEQPFDSSRVLYSEIIPYTNPSASFGAHNFPATTKNDINNAAWAYLLGSTWVAPPPTSVEEQILFSDQSKIYPNPSNGLFSITYTNYINVELQFFNSMGILVLKQNLQSAVTKVDLSFATAGVYTYQLIRNGVVVDNGKLLIK